eukprot:CAMPEP_0184288486 /NCGR_PEP_ID=MMETSP1049-20130417/1009_1 /TAXON_ID=77928 /ORGANISM="Proteomonas sulcata, Strain CCMP704" /LENGTH=363 /DNA_ID=CAMNT_0026594903 /DNA_START=32 /DNA_END=1123 /DNA_ORIENTATION=-
MLNLRALIVVCLAASVLSVPTIRLSIEIDDDVQVDVPVKAPTSQASQVKDAKSDAEAKRLCNLHDTPKSCNKDVHCYWMDNWLSADECVVKQRRPDPHCEKFHSEGDCGAAANCFWIEPTIDKEHSKGRHEGWCQQTPEHVDVVEQILQAVSWVDASDVSDDDEESSKESKAAKMCRLHDTPKSCNKDKHCYWLDNWLSADECVVKHRRPDPHCDRYRSEGDCAAAENCFWVEPKADDKHPKRRHEGWCQQTPEDETSTDQFSQDVSDAAAAKSPEETEAARLCHLHDGPKSCNKDEHCFWIDNWLSADECVVKQRRPDPHCDRFRSEGDCAAAANCCWVEPKADDRHPEWRHWGWCQQTPEH